MALRIIQRGVICQARQLISLLPQAGSKHIRVFSQALQHAELQSSSDDDVPPLVVEAVVTKLATPVGYNPTSLSAVEALNARRMPQLGALSHRWNRMRIAWLVTGSMDVTTYDDAKKDGAISESISMDRRSSIAARVDAGDLSDEEIEVLLRDLEVRKANKKRRRVRVNAASIKRVLRDPERNETVSFTRPLPLPQMVELLAEHWDENEGV